MKQTKFLSLLLLGLLCSVEMSLAGTKTYSFASSAELDNLTYTAGDASDTWNVCTSKTNDIEVRDGGFVQYKNAQSSKTATFVTKQSFNQISNISFYIASSDKGKTKLKIEVSSKEDFSSDVTVVVNATGGLSDLGITSPANKTWYSVSQDVAAKSGYVRFTMTSGSSGKYWSFDDIVITYASKNTVTFNAGSNGTCGTSSITEASIGAGVTLPVVTANTGYTFNGWYTAATAGTRVGGNGNTYHPTADIELFAQYSANTYTITLNGNGETEDGSATATYNSDKLTSMSAPAWAGHSVVGYYKEAECTNLIADAEGNLQAGTDYTDGSKNWTSTSNQTLYAKWMTANNATFSDGAYIIGGSALNLNSLFANGNGEEVTYSVKNDNGTGVTIAGSMFTATAAGTATVRATQAASASVAGATLDAEITVSVNPLGEHTLTWTIKTGTTQTAFETKSKNSSSTNIGSLSAITLNNLEVRTGGGKDNSSPKVETPSTETSTKYTYVTFKVASGYKFILKKVTTKLVSVSHTKTVKCEISDNNGGATQSLSYNQSNNSDPGATHNFTFTTNNMYSGTVTVKLYIYGSDADDYRMGKPLTIEGIVVEETPVSVSLNGTVKYATYHNFSNAYVMPAGLEGIVVSGNEGTTLTLNTAYNAGDIVPAHEPLILHAADIDENTNFSLYLTYTASEPKTNMLKGLDANGTTIGEGKHYHLSYDTEDPAGTVGFYYGAADGNPFLLNVDKAYLVIPAGSSAPSRFLLNEEENNATNVENIEANEKAVKFIENGRILIKKNGIVYDALGRIVK